MRLSTLARLARATTWYARGGRFVFVVGHMRSGSSLLAHILQSHPDVTGIGESHRVYRGARDLVLLAAEVAHHRELARLPPIVLEKALDHGQVGERVLTSSRVRVVVIVREPRATMCSMIDDLPGLIGGADVPLTVRVARAARNLASAYDELAEHASRLGSGAFVIDYADLVQRPEPTLAALTRWLALSPPLSTRYRIDALTHAVTRGDPTAAILSGRIDPSIARATFELDPDWLALVERRHARLRAALAGCSGLPGGAPRGPSVR